MMLVIVFNLVLIVFQTDKEALCFPLFEDRPQDCPTHGDNISWLRNVNLALVVFYTLEATIKIYAARRSYFEQVGNILDFLICVLSILAELLDGLIPVSWLRVFRLWRLVRVMN